MANIDRLRQAFPNLKNADDATVIGEAARLSGASYSQVAEMLGVAPEGGLAGFGRQFMGGLTVDAPEQVGKAFLDLQSRAKGVADTIGIDRFFPSAYSDAESAATTARGLVDSAQKRQSRFEPDTRDQGVVSEVLGMGARGLGAALPSLVTTIANPYLGGALAFGQYGGSSSFDTRKKVLEAGGTQEEADLAATKVFGIQGGLEAATNVVTAGLARPVKDLSVGLAKSLGVTGQAVTTKGVAKALANPTAWKDAGKAYVKSVALNTITEPTQDLLTRAVEVDAGVTPDSSALETAIESAKGGFGMGVLLGPLFVGQAKSRTNRAKTFKNALENPDAPPEAKALAQDMVMSAAREQGVADADVGSWFNEQLTAEDARNDALSELEKYANLSKTYGSESAMGRAEGVSLEQQINQLVAAARLEEMGVPAGETEVGLSEASKKTKAKSYAAQFEEAFAEPSGQFANDPATGVERELSVGEAMLMQAGVPFSPPSTETEAKPNAAKQILTPAQQRLIDAGVNPYQRGASKKATDVLDKISASGLPEDVTAPVLTLLQDSKFKAADTMLTKLYAEAELAKVRNVSQTTTPVSGAAGLLPTGGVDVLGGVGAAGLAPAGVGQSGADLGTVPTAGEANVVSTVPRKRAPTVAPTVSSTTPTVAVAPTNTAAPFEADTVDENTLEIARMTGQEGLANVVAQEQEGSRADEVELDEAAVQAVIEARLASSQNKDRDRAIINEYLAVLRAPNSVGKAALKEAIASKYGIKDKDLAKIGNPTELVKAAGAMGFSAEQARLAFNVRDTTKAAAGADATTTSQLKERLKKVNAKITKATAVGATTTPEVRLELQNQRISLESEIADATKAQGANMSAELATAGFTADEKGNGGFGMDDSRYWAELEDDATPATQIIALADKLDALENALAEFEALGNAEAVAQIRGELDKAQTALDAKMAQVNAQALAAKKGKPTDAKAATPKVVTRKQVTAPKKGAQIIDLAAKLKEKADAAEDLAGFDELAKAVAAENISAVREAAAKLRGLSMLMERADKSLESAARDPQGRVAGLSIAVQLDSYLREYIAISEDADAALAGEREGADLVARAEAISNEEALSDIRELSSLMEDVNKQRAEMANFVETPFMAAERAWDAEVQTYDSGPLFENLTRDQQQDFIEFGEANWGPADVTLMLAKIQNTTIPVANDADMRKVQVGERVGITADDISFSGVRTTPELLRRYPGIDRSLSAFEKDGMSHLMDAVDYWLVVDNSVDFDAAVFPLDGKRVLAFRLGVLGVENSAFLSANHEIGHVADNVYDDAGVYSGVAQLNVRIVEGKARGMGAVARDIITAVENNTSAALTAHFAYPLGSNITKTDRMREELFAQLWAARSDPVLREELANTMPFAFDFIEDVYEAEKSKASRPASTASATAAPEATTQPKANQSDIRAPRNVPAGSIRRKARTTKRNIDKLPKALQDPVRNSVDALMDFGNKTLDTLGFTSDLIERAVKAGVGSAELIGRHLKDTKTRTGELTSNINKILEMYLDLPEVDRGTGTRSVNRFLFDSTREGKWGYGKFADPEMAARFALLSPESQAFVKAVFAHGDKMLALKKKTVLDATQTSYDGRIADAVAAGNTTKAASLTRDKAAALKKYESLFKISEGKPYAPIKRAGNYVVVAKSKAYIAAENAEVKDAKAIAQLESSGDHYHVTFTDSKGEARALQRQLDEQGSFDTINIGALDQQVDNLYNNTSSLKELLKLKEAARDLDDVDAKAAGKLSGVIADLYLNALADGGARKSEMRRKGVDGEVDMVRSFASQGMADASFIANAEFGPKVQAALRRAKTESTSGGDTLRKTELRNELVRRYLQTMDYTSNPWISKLLRMSSIHYLATSPAYYLQNGTQPWLMSQPLMAGRHGYFKSAKALSDAYGELGEMIKSASVFTQQFDFDKVPADVRPAIKELANRDMIDLGIDSEMGEFRVGGEGKVAEKWNAVDKGLRLMVQKVEAINRVSTAAASYRLEFAKSGDVAQSLKYAEKILQDSHGDYSSFNAPRVFNTNFGRIALQFRKFQLIQMGYYAKLLDNSFRGDDKIAARQALGYSLAHTAALAGVKGVPLFTTIAWAIGALFGDDDDETPTESKVRNALVSNFGETVADLIMYGTPTLVGADISGKVGAGNVLSLMPYSRADLTTTSGQAQAVGEFFLGASGGMTVKIADGVGLMAQGDWYKGVEQTMPKGIADMLKAGRFAFSGLTRRNGDITMSAEEVSALDTLWKSIGISPVKQSVMYQKQQALRDMEKSLNSESSRIKSDYAKAAREKDKGGMAEAREEWKKLQDKRDTNGFRRQAISGLLRAPLGQVDRERRTVGGVQFNKSNQRAAESLL